MDPGCTTTLMRSKPTPKSWWASIDPIPGAADLRGRTPDLRRLAYLVSRAGFVLCLEGLYNHMAAAFRTPAFVVCSGFTHPELAAYPDSVLLSAAEQPPCAPCWLRTPCPVPGKPCMAGLTPEFVAAAIARRFPPPPPRPAGDRA